jgi:hypothetical protein
MASSAQLRITHAPSLPPSCRAPLAAARATAFAAMQADEFDDADEDDEDEEGYSDDDDGADEDEEPTLLVDVADPADAGVTFHFAGVPDFDFPECRLDITGEARRGGTLIATLSGSCLDRDAMASNPLLLCEVADAHSSELEAAVCTFINGAGRLRCHEVPTLCPVAHAGAQHGSFLHVDSVIVVVEERRRELGLRFVRALLDAVPFWTLAVMSPRAWQLASRDDDDNPPDKGLRTLNLLPAAAVDAQPAHISRDELVHACVAAAAAARDGALLPVHLRLIEAALWPREQRADRAVCLHFARLGFQQCAPADEHFFVTPDALRLCSREQAHDKPIALSTPDAPLCDADVALNEAVAAQLASHADVMDAPSEAVHAALADGAQPDRARVLHAVVTQLARDVHHTDVARAWVALRMIVTVLGAGVDAADEGGSTALHLAASYHYAPAVTSLLALGASCGVYNERGHTPAHVASRQSRTRGDFFRSGPLGGSMAAAHANLHAILHAHDGAAFRASLGLRCGALLTPRMHYRLSNVAGLLRDEQYEVCHGEEYTTEGWMGMSPEEQHAAVHCCCTGYDHLPPRASVALFRDAAALRGMFAVSNAIYTLLEAGQLPSADAVRRAAPSSASAYYSAGGAVEHMLGAMIRLGMNDDIECGGENGEMFEDTFAADLAPLPWLPLLEDDFLFVAHALGVPEACLVRTQDPHEMWRAHALTS